MSLNRRQIPTEAFNPDRCELPCATLSQRRGADVTRQNVGVAVDAERLVLVRVDGIVPSACRQLNHATSYPLGQDNAGQAGSALVRQTDDVAALNALNASVVGMHARHLAPTMLRSFAVSPKVELAVQTGSRLVGE